MPTAATLKLAALAAAFLAALMGGWYVRGLVADNDMAEFKEELRAKQDDQRDLTMKVETADTRNTQESTARIDAAQVEQQKEIQYVDREVIRYVRDPGNGRCALPARWVQLYNEAAGLPGGVPETSAAGPQADGTGR